MRTARLASTVLLLGLVGAAVGPTAPTAAADSSRTTVEVYDSFDSPSGYGLQDYEQRWATLYGPGEMAAGGTRTFADGTFTASAVPFRTGYDVSVYDHIKYLATSRRSFPVPEHGWVEFSARISAVTPGTQPGRVVHGTYTATGQPWSSPLFEGQQAAATLHMIDFRTGQLFDWFVSGSRAFTLVERLPRTVTGGPEAGTRGTMYTQIVDEVPLAPGPHTVSLRFLRTPGGSFAEYRLDGVLVSKVQHVGVPLDVQHVPYTGLHPSLGPGEEVADRMDHLTIGHGLFSLLDAFPYRHPDVPELDVSIPLSQRLFGQGARGTFDDVVVTTRSLSGS